MCLKWNSIFDIKPSDHLFDIKIVPLINEASYLMLAFLRNNLYGRHNASKKSMARSKKDFAIGKILIIERNLIF